MELAPELLQPGQTVGLLTGQKAHDQAHGFPAGSLAGRSKLGQQARRHGGVIEYAQHVLQVGQVPDEAPGRLGMPDGKNSAL